MFTKLLLHDAALVYAIQRALSPLPLLSSLSTLGSSLGDPRYSYTVTFPLVYWLLGPGAGVHVLATAALAEWCNITLKWYMHTHVHTQTHTHTDQQTRQSTPGDFNVKILRYRLSPPPPLSPISTCTLPLHHWGMLQLDLLGSKAANCEV